MNSYFEEVQALLTIVGEQEKQSIKESVEHISKAVMSDGIIHLFGSGHSHILTEEVFYRAGGLAAIRPIFVEDLMLLKELQGHPNLNAKMTYQRNSCMMKISVLVMSVLSFRHPA